jgi:hypothetical protein
MTQNEFTYAETLNLLGSDVPDKLIQDIIDDEHAILDDGFKAILNARRRLATATNC